MLQPQGSQSIQEVLEKSVFEGNWLAARNAIQTAVVRLEGTHSIGNEWGLGVRVSLKTTRGTVVKPQGLAHWSQVGDEIVGHSKRALLCLLAPFGIDWAMFEKAFPRPLGSFRIDFTLLRIIQKLRPELV